MACHHPLTGYRRASGKVKFTHTILPDWPGAVTVSCGRCTGCRLDHARDWAVRIMHESQLYERSSFITLTYDDDLVPDQLILDHWQNFAKKFRRDIGPFRFFHCGEYGAKLGRPHLHAAIFGHDFSHDRVYHDTTANGDTLWKSKTLEHIWGKGFTPIGDLTFESAGYIARYTLKKKARDGTPGKAIHQHGDRKRPYTTMSRNPGLGKGWLDKYYTDVYPRDHVVTNGRQAPPPKFYDGILEYTDPTLHAKLKQERTDKAKLHKADNTPARLRDKEIVLEAKMKMLNRELE